MQDDSKEESYQPLGFPLKCGSYETVRYLLADQQLRPGAWVDGQTVYGDFTFRGRKWATFTRPVFAYLVYVDTQVQHPGTDRTPNVRSAQGHDLWFFKGAEKDYAVSPAIDVVNTHSELLTGFSAQQAWARMKARQHTLTLPSSTAYSIYQMHLVYAHCVVGAADAVGSLFQLSRRVLRCSDESADLYFLSSVATSQLGACVTDQQLFEPLSREDLLKTILVDGHSPGVNTGVWSLDLDARDNLRKQY
ncbi:monalysin family beta-barrel pore-forming toxin [Pseudomonas sp. SBB6]|uniref:monalysin family beta-barrel pore-forming toxin n=1 Tax=Pseudomonas sp. SBB6 TaxID=2962032 RepID=UPI0020B870ED|nr:monalysin family beta-barrel pore-forming toxin [Pseudomonas sp. SBB6]MCP3749793.1 monalysin family beta-barrel pore-forming toxin [Pseudomonas sp. SBB6]